MPNFYLANLTRLLRTSGDSPWTPVQLAALERADQHQTLRTYLRQDPAASIALIHILETKDHPLRPLMTPYAQQTFFSWFQRKPPAWFRLEQKPRPGSITVRADQNLLPPDPDQMRFPEVLIRDLHPDGLEGRAQSLGAKVLSLESAETVDELMTCLTSNPYLLGPFLGFMRVFRNLKTDTQVVSHFRDYFRKTDDGLPSSWNNLIERAKNTEGPHLKIALEIRRAIGPVLAYFSAGSDFNAALPQMAELARQGIGFSFEWDGGPVTTDDSANQYLYQYLLALRGIIANQKNLAVGVKEDSKQILGRRTGRMGVGFTTSFQVESGMHRAADGTSLYLLKPAYLPSDNGELAIKLSALSPQWNPADPERTAAPVKERLRHLLRALLEAQKQQARIQLVIKAESAESNDLIYDIFESVFDEPEFQTLENIGIEVDASMHNALAVIHDLAIWVRERKTKNKNNGESIGITLVKGDHAYAHKQAHDKSGYPVPAFLDPADIHVYFERCTDLIIENCDALRLTLSTADKRAVAYGLARAEMATALIEIKSLPGFNAPAQRATSQIAGIRTKATVLTGPNLSLVQTGIANPPSAFRLFEGLTQGAPDTLFANPGVGKTWPAPLPTVRIPSLPTEIEAPFTNEPLTDFSIPENSAAVRNALEALHTQAAVQHETNPLIIGGHLYASESTFATLNPSNPVEVLARFASAEPVHIEPAVEAAKASLKEWSGKDAIERGRHLLEAARLLRAHKAKLIALVMLEAGFTLVEADREVARATDYLEYYAREIYQLDSENNRRNEHALDLNPQGVVGIIGTWSAPLSSLANAAAAALAAGNTVILKPSEKTPLTGQFFYDLLRGEKVFKENIHEGVVTLLQGDSSTGKALVDMGDLQMIAYAGSVAHGLEVHEKAASLQLPLVADMRGGHTVIVDDDIQMGTLIQTVRQTAFHQQAFSQTRAILVGDEPAYTKNIQELVKALEPIQLGSVELFGAAYGPLIDEIKWTRFNQLVDDARTRPGVKLIYDGRFPHQEGYGYFMGPVLFEVSDFNDPLWTTGMSGPILCLKRAATLEEAIELANKSSEGTAASLLTLSPSSEAKVIGDLTNVGNLFFGQSAIEAKVGRAAIGGSVNTLAGIGSAQPGTRDYLQQFINAQLPDASLYALDKEVFEVLQKWTHNRLANGIQHQPERESEISQTAFRPRENGVILSTGAPLDFAGYLAIALETGHPNLHVVFAHPERATAIAQTGHETIRTLLEANGYDLGPASHTTITRGYPPDKRPQTVIATHAETGRQTRIHMHQTTRADSTLGMIANTEKINWVAHRDSQALPGHVARQLVLKARVWNSAPVLITANPRAAFQKVFAGMTSSHTVAVDITQRAMSPATTKMYLRPLILGTLPRSALPPRLFARITPRGLPTLIGK